MDSYVLVKSGSKISLPDTCPKCGQKLSHTNGLDTVCRLYVVFCRGWGCMWGEVYRFE